MKQENDYYPEWKRGSIKECNISPWGYIEYKQTGMIKVKEVPVSRGEISRLASRRSLSYYDLVYNQKFNWLEDLDFFHVVD